MKSVKVRDNRGDSKEEQQDVTDYKVCRIQSHFNSLNHKLSSRLRESVRSQTPVEPNTSPPRSVCLVMLELSRQEDGNENLEDTPLNSNDRNDTENGMTRVPELEEPEEFEESHDTNHSTEMGNGGHGGSELIGV